MSVSVSLATMRSAAASRGYVPQRTPLRNELAWVCRRHDKTIREKLIVG